MPGVEEQRRRIHKKQTPGQRAQPSSPPNARNTTPQKRDTKTRKKCRKRFAVMPSCRIKTPESIFPSFFFLQPGAPTPRPQPHVMPKEHSFHSSLPHIQMLPPPHTPRPPGHGPGPGSSPGGHAGLQLAAQVELPPQGLGGPQLEAGQVPHAQLLRLHRGGARRGGGAVVRRRGVGAACGVQRGAGGGEAVEHFELVATLGLAWV